MKPVTTDDLAGHFRGQVWRARRRIEEIYWKRLEKAILTLHSSGRGQATSMQLKCRDGSREIPFDLRLSPGSLMRPTLQQISLQFDVQLEQELPRPDRSRFRALRRWLGLQAAAPQPPLRTTILRWSEGEGDLATLTIDGVLIRRFSIHHESQRDAQVSRRPRKTPSQLAHEPLLLRVSGEEYAMLRDTKEMPSPSAAAGNPQTERDYTSSLAIPPMSSRTNSP